MDSDAIWQVHLWGPVTHCCVTLQGKGDLRIEIQNMQLQIAAATCEYKWAILHSAELLWFLLLLQWFFSRLTDDFTQSQGRRQQQVASTVPQRRGASRSVFHATRQSWPDSDSDTEDFLHVLTESRKAYVFTESTLEQFRRDHVEGTAVHEPAKYVWMHQIFIVNTFLILWAVMCLVGCKTLTHSLAIYYLLGDFPSLFASHFGVLLVCMWNWGNHE